MPLGGKVDDLQEGNTLNEFEVQSLRNLVSCAGQVFFNDVSHRISVEYMVTDTVVSCFISPIPPNDETHEISFVYNIKKSEFVILHPVSPDVSYVKAFLNGYAIE